MTQTLKRCPFCGHSAKIEYEEMELLATENWLHVVCTECGGSSGWYMNADSAREAWNMRCNDGN